jgi:hypothetical protein
MGEAEAGHEIGGAFALRIDEQAKKNLSGWIFALRILDFAMDRYRLRCIAVHCCQSG